MTTYIMLVCYFERYHRLEIIYYIYFNSNMKLCVDKLEQLFIFIFLNHFNLQSIMHFAFVHTYYTMEWVMIVLCQRVNCVVLIDLERCKILQHTNSISSHFPFCAYLNETYYRISTIESIKRIQCNGSPTETNTCTRQSSLATHIHLIIVFYQMKHFMAITELNIGTFKVE